MVELLNYQDNYEQIWTFETECDYVELVSKYMSTQKDFDILTIDGVKFSGTVPIRSVAKESVQIQYFRQVNVLSE